MKPDTAAAVDFLMKWRPEGPWVLSSILPGGKAMSTRTFRPDEIDPLYKWLDEFVGKRNIYFHVNPVLSDLTKKASKSDIRQADWIHVDIDPRDDHPFEDERARIQALITNLPEGVPKPTVIIDSGGGFQGFWKLADPVEIRGNEGKAEEFERYNQQISIVLGGDKSCHNVDRIMRLPGTINVPDERKLKKGRKPALARLISFDASLVYPISDFIPAAELQVGSGSSFSSGQKVDVSGNVAFLESIHDLDKWGVPDRLKALIVQGTMEHLEGRKANDNSRSAWLFDAVCNLVRCGVPDEVIYAVIMDPGNGISASILDKGAAAHKSALHQIASAKDNAIHPLLHELNRRYAVIGNLGGKCRIIEETMDLALGRTKVTRQSFDDFRNRFMHQKIEISNDPQKGPSYMPLGKWWLLQPSRRQFDTMVFAPNRDVHEAYNLWRGFSVVAKPGSCEKFIRHVRENICQDNEVYFDYLMGWMARAVQHPDSPGQTALVLRGKQGTGKSFFAKTFGSLWGRHFLAVSDPKHLVGSFNAHLRDCVVLFGDEAFYAGDKKHESILKTLVTEETIVIEGKGVDAEAAPNFTHIILASNSQWVVPAGADERRYFVLDVGFDQMQNSAYFREIAQELDNGGREALLHMLMTRNLSEFDVRKVPKTGALQEQKLLSLSSEEEWWYNKLVEGRILQDQDSWHSEVMKDALLDDYVEYMKKLAIQRRSTATALGRFLKRVCPGDYPRSYQKLAMIEQMLDGGYVKKTQRRVYFWGFPGLAEARKQWDATFGGQNDWPPEQEDLPLNIAPSPPPF